jgi:hypothetical protein
MGLTSWWRRRRMGDPVAGSLRVTVCPQPHTAPESLSYSAIVIGVVSGPGIEPTAVEHHCTVPARRCPESGQEVPVTVDRADPTRIVIEWDRVPVRDPLARARDEAEALADSMRGE